MTCTNPVTQRFHKASNNTKEFCSQATAQTDHRQVLLTSASFENFRISFTVYNVNQTFKMYCHIFYLKSHN